MELRYWVNTLKISVENALLCCKLLVAIRGLDELHSIAPLCATVIAQKWEMVKGSREWDEVHEYRDVVDLVVGGLSEVAAVGLEPFDDEAED